MELNKIRSTHRALPMPVFTRSLSLSRELDAAPSTADWTLMKPKDYALELPGAITLTTFYLVHFDINGNDYWHAVPYSMRLLKSKLATGLDPHSSPYARENADLIFGSPYGSSSGCPATQGSSDKTNKHRKKQTSDSAGDTPSKKRSRKHPHKSASNKKTKI